METGNDQDAGSEKERTQGKERTKKPVLFPKIVFLYDENLHGPGKPLEDV